MCNSVMLNFYFCVMCLFVCINRFVSVCCRCVSFIVMYDRYAYFFALFLFCVLCSVLIVLKLCCIDILYVLMMMLFIVVMSGVNCFARAYAYFFCSVCVMFYVNVVCSGLLIVLIVFVLCLSVGL